MKYYLLNKNSDNLLIFFTGWGCDESEFEHLRSNSNVLFLYNYTDLELDFDFSNYKKFNLIAFSAGVFVASVMEFDFKTDNNIAISGNPYLFDEELGLSKNIQDVLCNINENNADYFARNYLIKTEEEWMKFHHSKRSLESCMIELNCLKELYKHNKQNINDIFDMAIVGSDDKIFNVNEQKLFYGNRLNIVNNARHNLFFRINSYDDLFNMKILL